MSHKYYIFTDPPNAVCQLFTDSGYNTVAIPDTHPSGRQGQVFNIPDNVPANQGTRLYMFAEGRASLDFRGILTYADEQYAYMQLDDFTLPVSTSPSPTPIPPPDTGGPATNSPSDIIAWVFSNGGHDLSTHDGCGEFTEECCDELHERNSELWGHIRKNPGQNQYNTHAVDAVQCLGGPEYGIWDIIHDSVSPNATWAYNNKGPADPNLFCYPASSCGVQSRRMQKEVSDKGHK